MVTRLEGGILMTSEKPCIFNRGSKCIFKGGVCDLDCDASNGEGDIQNPNLLNECLGKGGKLALSKRFFQSLLP